MTDVMTDAELVKKALSYATIGTQGEVTLQLAGNAVRVTREAYESRIQSLTADLERAKAALRPFAFMDMGKDEDEGVALTTQDVWETIYGNRVKDWFDYDAIDKARRTLKDISHD